MILPSITQARNVRVGNKLIEIKEINEIEYVPVGKIVAALQGKIWQFQDKWIVTVPSDTSNSKEPAKGKNLKKEHEIIFSASLDTILVNNRAVPSLFPIQISENELLIPVFVLGEVFPLPEPTVPEIHSIAMSQIRDTTVLAIEVDTSIIYETEVLSSLEYHLYLQAISSFQNLKPRGIIKRIVLESKSGTFLAFFFNKPCDQKVRKNSGGLVLKFYPRPEKKITTIVLDPGHGGIDPGAIGRTGLKEKQVNLGVALRLKDKLVKSGLKVTMTRTDDSYVSLADRVKFAKLANADLFVSIHSNAALRDRSKRGIETYFLSDAKTDWERAVAARENAAVNFEISDTNPVLNNDLNLILSDLAQNEFLAESQQLAASIQEATASACRIPNRGVMQANFYVLRVNFMPAVLVECGYISNSAEVKLLAKKDYWEKLAAGIFKGVKKFITEYEKKFAER